MRRSALFATATSILLLSACAGRAPAPVALVQDKDRAMDCSAIQTEINGNNQQITDLSKEDGAKVGQNIAMGVAGVLIPVLWFGMDYQDASGKEGKALTARNSYLSQIAAQRCAQMTNAAPAPSMPMNVAPMPATTPSTAPAPLMVSAPITNTVTPAVVQ